MGRVVCTATDTAGRFRLVVAEGRYDFLADAKDRVSIAVNGRECRAGEKVELPPLTLIGGGFISGQAIDTTTRRSVSVTEVGEPVTLGLYGPAQPQGAVTAPTGETVVDKAGRFGVRVAPGEYFPYLVNSRGVHMAVDARKQPPVVVKDGETTIYNMLITPEASPAEKRQAARKLVEALPKQPYDRTAQILLEFRKLSHTVRRGGVMVPAHARAGCRRTRRGAPTVRRT